MKSAFGCIFARLREILQENAETLSVKNDTPDCYCLEASAGHAALRAWGGKMKKAMIPIAWVQIGKAYVSYHLMGVYENARLRDGMSKELKTHMQGKTCFNLKSHDEALFKELEELTAQAIAGFRKSGFIADERSA